VSLPGESVPEQYHTRPIGTTVTGPSDSDRNTSNLEWYDLFVTRPMPFVFAALLDNGVGHTQVVCVASDHVAEGSQEPEEDEPWDSAGVRETRVIAGHMATVAAIAVAVVVY
jgi:hypothetical protein